MVALLCMGSAILLVSCKATPLPMPVNEEVVVAQFFDSMLVISSENGKKSQRFFTPQMEDYAFAKEPFREYRKGIELIGYDSVGLESSNIVADYALNWTNRDLWELKGNVVVVGEQGRTLYSQQLFWDRKIKRIYSNVDSKVVEGEDVFIGEGFEADEDFLRWTFRKLKGTVSVDVQPTTKSDSIPSNSDAGALATPNVQAGTAKPSELNSTEL